MLIAFFTASLVLSQATACALSGKESRAISKRDGYIFWYWSVDTPTPGPVNGTFLRRSRA